jgi:gliding motility-associated-like protein
MDLRQLTVAALCAVALPGFAQLTLNTTLTPADLVQNVLLGGGVTASNITFNGAPGTSLTAQMAQFDGSNCNVGIAAGIMLATGGVSNAYGPNDEGGATTAGGTNAQGDADLLALAQSAQPNVTELHDAAVLEFDFMVTGDSLKFNFVFGSEEYMEFVGSINDAFGFFLSGPGITGTYSNNAINVALIPGTTQPVTINSVNANVNPLFYVNNGDGYTSPWNASSQYVQYDGLTTVLTARAGVICGETYHIKIVVADASDSVLDSGVFLEAGSFASTGQVIPSLNAGVGGLAMNDTVMFEGCGVIPFNFHRLGDTSLTDTVHLVIGGTATAGVDYYPPIPAQFIYQPGDTVLHFPLTVPYDADGLETLTIQVTENIVCSGMQVITDYTFWIDQYPDLQVSTTDVNGLCETAYDIGPVVSQGVGLYGYLWNTGDTTATINVQVDSTTVFYVTVTDTCSLAPVLDSITVNIPVYPVLQVTASPDVAIPCLGTDSLQVTSTNGGNGQYLYAWTVDGVAYGTGPEVTVPAGPPTWYVVTATEGCGHSASDSVLVSTIPLPPVEILNWDSTVFCAGDTVTLRPAGVTGGNGVYSYLWWNAAGDTLSWADSLQVGVPTDSVFTLHVQDQCGYMADSVFRTLVPVRDPFVLVLTPDSVICAGDSLTIWAQVSGGSGVYTYDWQGWSWNDPKYLYGGDTDTSFTVRVTDQCGELVEGLSQVTVQHAEAQILLANQGEDDWLFQARTVPFEVPVVLWDLGDGTRVKSPSARHSYGDLEDHWVHLDIVSAEGCKATDSLLVVAPGALYFPNAFTPDGDGINDDFGASGAVIAEFRMQIFDRWGHEVYRSERLEDRWDGTVNGGAPAQSGVYVYMYRAKGHYFEADERYGHVTLVRGTNGR